jgi:hypothetical protein
MRTQEQRPGRDISAWRVPVTCLGAVWLLWLTALPTDASQPSPSQSSQESFLVAPARTEGALDHADVGMTDSVSLVIRHDHTLDRRAGLRRCRVAGLRMRHAVLRL